MSLMDAITMEPCCKTDRLLLYFTSVKLNQKMNLYTDFISYTIDRIGKATLNWTDE